MKFNLQEYIFKKLHCIYCQDEYLHFVSFNALHNKHEGVFYCLKCKRWYPYSENVIEVLPDNKIDWSYRSKFLERFRALFHKYNIDVDSDSAFIYKAGFVKQCGFSDSLTESYDSFMWETSFWQKVESYYKKKWIKSLEIIRKDGIILEPGCGSGRISNQFSKFGFYVVGVDITYAMINKANENAIRSGVTNNVIYFVADAECLPFAANTFDACFFAGFLHHLNDPVRGLMEMRRVLKQGASILGMDNHKSSARWIFDLLMKVFPLWKEEGGTHQTMSVKQLKQWGELSKIEISAIPYCFIPPHLYKLLGRKYGDSLFNWTNKIFRNNAFLKSLGGLLDIEGRAV